MSIIILERYTLIADFGAHLAWKDRPYQFVHRFAHSLEADEYDLYAKAWQRAHHAPVSEGELNVGRGNT